MNKPMSPLAMFRLWKRAPVSVRRVSLAAGAVGFLVLALPIFLTGGVTGVMIGLVCMLGVVVAMIKEIERRRSNFDRGNSDE